MFKDYDTTKIDASFDFFNKPQRSYHDPLFDNEIIDTNLQYDMVYMGIDNHSHIQSLLLRKDFLSGKTMIDKLIKDSIHNFLKTNFKILKNFYGTNFSILLDKSEDLIYPDILNILWEINDNLICISFSNIYDTKLILTKPNYYIWLINISFYINAGNDSYLNSEFEKMKNVSKLYNPKSMGWE